MGGSFKTQMKPTHRENMQNSEQTVAPDLDWTGGFGGSNTTRFTTMLHLQKFKIYDYFIKKNLNWLNKSENKGGKKQNSF